MHMKRDIIILASLVSAVLASVSVTADARTPYRPSTAYGYGHTIEMQLGWAGSPFAIDGEARRARGMATGADFDLRYSYFFGRHFGAYAQVEFAQTSASQEYFFGVVNRADGNKYKYSNEFYKGYSDMKSRSYSPLVSVGGVYRLDFGQWSFRPRVGMGFGSFKDQGYSYMRMSRDGELKSQMFFDQTQVRPQLDYMEAYFGRKRSPAFFLSLSAQLTYTIRNHFFFSVEAGLKDIPTTVAYVNETYKSKYAYNPQTWVEAVQESDYIGQYTKDPSTVTSDAIAPSIGSLLNLNFGIGWNIGWNRNDNHRRW